MPSLGRIHTLELRLEGSGSGRVEFASVRVQQEQASPEDAVEMRGEGGGGMVLAGKSLGVLSRNEGVSVVL
jgi:hypothetical protein